MGCYRFNNVYLVLLTGPTPGGIGAETLVSLAAESPAMLIVVGRSAEKAQATTIDAIKGVNADVKAKFVEADLTSLKSVRKGCGTTLRAALDPNLVKEGVYMNDTLLTTDPKWVKAWATNPDFAERLWTMSEELVGEKFVF